MKTNTPVPVAPFILSPKSQQEAGSLLQYLYAEHYLDEIAPSTCPKCKVKRVRRTCAEGEFGRHGNRCTVAFDYCPNCRRVKPDTPHQRKLMGLVKNIRPLDLNYVLARKKFAQAVNVQVGATPG